MEITEARNLVNSFFIYEKAIMKNISNKTGTAHRLSFLKRRKKEILQTILSNQESVLYMKNYNQFQKISKLM